MSKIKYRNWNPNSESLILVEHAESIITEYQAAGYTLTLRQVYYQFVARGLIENSIPNYKKLGSILTKARLAGLVSWEAIEDRNRERNSYWFRENEDSLIEDLKYHIRFDQWARQDTYVEVWVEKEALGNVISKACDPLLIPNLACKGYLSASEAWRAGQRFLKKMNEGKECVLIHLGDHDPSGIDMTCDNDDRLGLFTQEYDRVDVRRIALNMDQVDEYSPPPNPTKLKDTRSKDYIKRFGHTSWELDALEPSIIVDLITKEVSPFIDQSIWDEVSQQEAEVESILENLYDKWPSIKTGLL